MGPWFAGRRRLNARTGLTVEFVTDMVHYSLKINYTKEVI